jgi:DNA polymerase III delta subunit
MPKLEPKQVQKELESGTLWPVYWLYGQERMKSRELLKRIRKAALGHETAGCGGLGFGEETLDGSEAKAAQIVDTAQSLSLGGGIRLVVVRDAHAIKDAEELSALLGKPGKKEELGHVCVFLSKDLDGRKKFSKLLVEKAAVVACEEIPEEEREAWIGYLSKRKGVELGPELVSQMRSLDPWSLDIIEQELEKYSLAQESSENPSDVLLGSLGSDQGTEAFLNAFFGRDERRALSILGSFVESADETLPLLGLLGWNVRYLALVIADQERRTRFAKLSPYLAERFNRWARHWKLAEVLELQEALAEIDFSMKQTARMPLGLWATLVQRFKREQR